MSYQRDKSVFQSATHGPIPLSITSKRLMHELRVAINDAIQAADYNCQDKVAHARGELAQYMSALGSMPLHVIPEQPLLEGTPNKPTWVTATTPRPQEDAIYSFWTGTRLRWNGPPANLQNLPKSTGKLTENMVQARAPINTEEIDMSKKAVATRKKAAKAEEKMQLVGVRFLQGHDLNKIYTYKAKRAAKLHLGQEVVIRNQNGTTVAVVVQLNPPMPVGYGMLTLEELIAKVASL